MNDGSALTGTLTFANNSATVLGNSAAVYKTEVSVGDVVISNGGKKYRVKDLSPARTVATSAVSTSGNSFTIAGHGYEVNQEVTYNAGGGTVATGLTDGQIVFVKAAADANTITVSATEGGAVIGITGTGNNAQNFTGQSNKGMTLSTNATASESGVAVTKTRAPHDFTIAAPHIADDYLGIDNTETKAGLDNITSISLQVAGTAHRTAPTVSIAVPTIRTVATSKVSTAANTITMTAHGMLTGTKLTYQDGSGTALAGLADDTSYFVVVIDANTIKLASSLSNAQAASPTTIALTGTGNNAQTFQGDTATATATVSAAGKVTGVSISAVGSDYQSVPAVTIAAPATETLDLTDTSVAILADDEIVVANAFYTKIETGDAVTYSKGSGGTAIAGVAEGTVFLIKSGTANKISLATSEYKATTGDKIDLTAVAAGGTAHTLIGVTPTATAIFGMGSSGKVGSGLNAHIGWVKKTVGTGGRAGRVTYETLVAGSSISGDASDDLNAPDS
jgi:hypothetical protein